MKKIKICILSCLSVFILTSCELNIVPDNIPTIEDHAFALRKEAEKVLFTCYRYMPSDGSLKNNVALLGAGDFCISDVFRSYLGTSAWYIAQGLQKSDSPYCAQWGHLYEGIAYCNILIMLIRRNVRLNVGRVTGEWPLSMLIIPCKHQYVRTYPYAAA